MKYATFLSLLLFGVAASASDQAVQDAVLLLEAEQFQEPRGWVNDQQFVDIMGSPYLLANAMGKPVEDAVTTMTVPRDADYRLWVRCRDWMPEHSPGTFQVVVAGTPSKTTFGAAQSDAWQWIDGGLFSLSAGQLEVRLHDLTGWWGRCDAIVLTTGAPPSNQLDVLVEQRQVHGGISATVEQEGPYDVVVVGGGLAGCAAAIAAARHNCSVALIQDRPILGGNASSEIRVAVSGDTSNEPWDPGETGIIEELRPPEMPRDYSKYYEQVIRGQQGLDLFLNTRATGAKKADDTTIAAIETIDVRTGQRRRFSGKFFIDCTGDGWVGHWAGAAYRRGREARSEFDEPAAPEKADAFSLSTSLNLSHFARRNQPVEFIAPEWCPQWESCDQFDPSSKKTVHSRGDLPPEGWHTRKPSTGRHPDSPSPGSGTWWLECGGTQDTIADAERIRDELFCLKLGLWDHVKNHCPAYLEENRNREFVWTSHIAGKRESRRLEGDYVFSQHDYMDRTIHPDTVLYAGYNVDPHHPQGFWTSGPQAFRLYHYKVSVPFRILYSKNIDNLLMAGRNVSATHVAFNGIRVQRITCVMGQVVGTAAGMAAQFGNTPRELCYKHITQLQQALLRDGCYLMEIPNEDPNDLALRAEVTASSHGTLDDTKTVHQLLPANVINGWNRAVHGVPNSWAPDTQQPGPHWIELDFGRSVAVNEVHVTFQLSQTAAKAYELAADNGSTWRPLCNVQDNAERRRVHRFDQVSTSRLRLTLKGNLATDKPVRICEIRAYGE